MSTRGVMGFDDSVCSTTNGLGQAFLVILLSITIAGAPTLGETYYVNADCGNDDWTGLSPECVAPNGPKATIGSLMWSVETGDEIIVADGTYIGSKNRNLHFGGKSVLLRSENGPGGCIIDCEQSGRGFNFTAFETLDMVVDGFTIRNGMNLTVGGGGLRCKGGNSVTVRDCVFQNCTGLNGGGIVCDKSFAVIQNCDLLDNEATEFGGGIYINACSPQITGCTLRDNSASSGGAFHCTDCDSAISDCILEDNEATGNHGGAAWFLRGKPRLSGCRILRNACNRDGGGLYCTDSDLTLVKCMVTSGNAGERGGGLFCSGGALNLSACELRSNHADEHGGGVRCYECPVTFTSSVFADNTASSTGGGGSVVGAPATIIGCAFIRNDADDGGGGLNLSGGTAVVDGSIFWDNTGSPGYQLRLGGPDTTIDFCDVQGGQTGVYVAGGTLQWGAGNIDADPLLIADDAHLQADSPCREAGDPNAQYPDDVDLDDEPRVGGDRMEIGADEFYDVDDDGLPDWWEELYFGSPTSADPNADDDEDGVTNIEEYINGTTPATPRTKYYVDVDGNDAWDGRAAVWNGVSGPKATIQAGINAALPGEESIVIVADGVYTGGHNKRMRCYGKTLILRSANGAEDCIIDCEGDGAAFAMLEGDWNTVIDGFTIRNGRQTAYEGGGGIYLYQSSPIIRNCRVEACTSDFGGGLYCSDCAPLILDCTFMDNTAEDGGGAYCAKDSHPTFRGCDIEGNVVSNDGGGIYVDDEGKVTIERCTLSQNEALDGAGGGAHAYRYGEGTIVDSVVTSNRAGGGGGLSGLSSAVNCEISGNVAEVHGGGGVWGAGLLDGCTIVDNTALEEGGGVRMGGGTIRHCTIAHNTAGTAGGGISSYSRDYVLALEDCTIIDNRAMDGQGGGVYAEYLSMERCRVARNVAFEEGGGVYATDRAAILSNCSIMHNVGTSGGGFHASCDTTELQSCTIARNRAGSGVRLTGVSATLTDCIFWENSVDGEFQLSLSGWTTASVAYCNVQGGQSGVQVQQNSTLDWGAGNLDVDPEITGTGNLLKGSICRDAGDPNGQHAGKTDIDGEARVDNGRIDIGADEYIDLDEDGLPDWFEQEHFGSPTSGEPGVDEEPDGRTNVNEYELGTHPHLAPQTYHVSPDGDDGWDGKAPAWNGVSGPKATLQGAVNVTNQVEGDTVLVADGVYSGSGNTEVDFAGRSLTLRSAANDPEKCVIDGEQAARAFRLLGVIPRTRLEGLTICNGRASGAQPLGGAIYCYGSEPTIANCVIEDCVAESERSDDAYGGGLYLNRSSPYVFNCVIRRNTARPGDGGGVVCTGGGAPVLVECTISDNEATKHGGGIACESDCYVHLGACRVERNQSGDGGGAHCLGDSCFENCIVRENEADYDGGGLYLRGGAPAQLMNCVLELNRAGSQGGGIDGAANCVNCVFRQNYSELWAGGIAGRYMPDGFQLVNCTFVRNRADIWGGGGVLAAGAARLVNCVLWDNRAPEGHEWAVDEDAVLTVTYSAMQGGEQEIRVNQGTLNWGDGNLTGDALLVRRDIHIQGNSPCRNAGDPAGSYQDQVDCDGEDRVAHERVDIGADEFHDDDADGLPNWWEAAHFGSPTAADPEADQDGDGRDNLAEYANGTNPLRAPVTFHASVNGNDGWNGLAPVWDGANGPKATIQAAIDLTDPVEGDAVRIGDGVYTGPGNRDIDFRGHAITVYSAHGADHCIVHCAGQGKGFSLHSGDADDSILRGVTVLEAGTYGVYCYASNPRLEACRFLASAYDGVICNNASPSVYQCEIIGSRHSGITISQGQPAIVNCLIADSARGGVITYASASALILNCTIVHNIASTNGGGIGGVATIRNSVLWGNDAPQGPQVSVTGLVDIAHCCIEGGQAAVHVEGSGELVWGAGNLDLDPLFVDPLSRDYRLLPGSPCIDAADNSALPADVFDLDGDGNTTEPVPFDLRGDLRFVDDPQTPDTGVGTPPIVDMGCHEYQADICRGDLNCDGFIDFGDINPFILSLSNWEEWQRRFADCPERNADVNSDGLYGGANGFNDINPFIKLLGANGGQPVPCGDGRWRFDRNL